MVAGFDVAGNAAAFDRRGACSPREAVGADTAAGVGDKIIGPAVGAFQSFLAGWEVRWGRARVLLWEDDEGDWDDDGGGDE